MTQEPQQSAGSPEPPDPVTGDDPDIPHDEVLYRRLSYGNGDWVVKDLVTGKRVRPASGAFKPDADGVSVYRRSLLSEQEPPLGPADLVVSEENLVIGVTVADVRSIMLGVRDDLWPQDVSDPDHPRNAAHALIVGLNGLSKNARIKRQKMLSTLPSIEFVHG